MDQNEQLQPFYLGANPPANEMNVKLMDAVPENACYLELVVVSGGPVFLFDGNIKGAAAYRQTRGDNTTSFALAASGNTKSIMGIRERYGAFTVAADVESIGYVRAYR